MVVVDERLEICEQENWLPLRRLFVRTYLKFAWGGDASLGSRNDTTGGVATVQSAQSQ
jgi:hypothetical protein